MKLAAHPVRPASTQTTLPATSYPLFFQSTGASLPSFFTRRPLFSIACSLFSENTRVGGYLHKSPLWNQQLPASFFRPCLQSSYPSRQSCLLSASRRLPGNRFIAPFPI